MATGGDIVNLLDLLGRAGYFIWESTRTSLDLNIENRHPHLALNDYIRYCRLGKCSALPKPFAVKPDQNVTFSFKANASRMQLIGSMIYRIDKLKGPSPNTKHLYLLLAWQIKIGGDCYFMLDLVESIKDAFNWKESHLKELYNTYIHKEFEETGTTLTRVWSLNNEDETTWFKVSVSMTDTRFGVMNVIIEECTERCIENSRIMRQPYNFRPEK
jgi:hypothetical protein